MSWLIGEIWLPLAFLAGFAIAWQWQRGALTPRIKSLEAELALCRRRSTEIDNERKQALARIGSRESDGAHAWIGPGPAEHDRPARMNA
jgi:hypothetical protein